MKCSVTLLLTISILVQVNAQFRQEEQYKYGQGNGYWFGYLANSHCHDEYQFKRLGDVEDTAALASAEPVEGRWKKMVFPDMIDTRCANDSVFTFYENFSKQPFTIDGISKKFQISLFSSDNFLWRVEPASFSTTNVVINDVLTGFKSDSAGNIIETRDVGLLDSGSINHETGEIELFFTEHVQAEFIASYKLGYYRKNKYRYIHIYDARSGYYAVFVRGCAGGPQKTGLYIEPTNEIIIK